MINKYNRYLQIKVTDKTFEFLSQFSDDFDVSISNFGEYCINSVISDLVYRTEKFNDVEINYFLQQFANQINNLYRIGARSK